MLLLRDRLLDLPIMSLQTGTRVGTIVKHIIDPRRLNVVAFYCEGPLIDFSPAILHVSDIREFSNLGLIVDSSDNIMSPDDLVRLEEVLSYQFELEDRPVVQEDGHKLGKIMNYTVDSESFYIIKLHIKPTFWQSLGHAEILVDRTQIAEINDKQIVVRNADIKGRAEGHKSSVPVIENPFRKHVPEVHGASNDEKPV
jgi:sporulation protein YlmC with PRC-barrel domain